MLTQLHELGIVLSVDDFGTGYSSLSHLSTLPIDSLKIDMSFVRKLSSDSKEAAVICAIILLGKSLGKMVIAEGIETLSQLTQLRELGCDVGQGLLPLAPLATRRDRRVARYAAQRSHARARHPGGALAAGADADDRLISAG